MQGQKQKTSLKILRNNAGKREIKTPEIISDSKLSDLAPRHLSKEAKKYWKDTVSKIKDIESVYLSIDTSYLARYCELKAEYEKWLQHVRENGIRVEEYFGEQVKIKESPEYKAVKNMTPIINQMETQLGLNPLGRYRLGMESGTKKDEDTLKTFLNRKSAKQASSN